ncbi:TPA: hypothetical protein MDQ74_000757 [Klebsiella pneumoniae]|nr:hypothetical protein [Klebsiella pneumoniae]
MKHQHGRESAGMIFIARFMNSFLHQASFATGYWCYDRHRSVRLVVLVGLAIDQIAQSGLSSLSVIYYSAQLFSSLSKGVGVAKACTAWHSFRLSVKQLTCCVKDSTIIINPEDLYLK